MRATYTGYLSVTYMNYTDLATGKTLQVEPGGTYDIAPDMPPADFIPADDFAPMPEGPDDESGDEIQPERMEAPLEDIDS